MQEHRARAGATGADDLHAVSQGRIGSRRIKQGILFERPIPTERKNDHANFNDVT